MPRISDSDYNVLASAPPLVEYYLAITPPQTVFKCRLDNATAAAGDTVLPYDESLEGDSNLVNVGMTLWVYDSTQATYKGKCRIRAITGAAITVGNSANIDFADDDVLRVLNHYEPWSKPTAMEEGGSGIVYYKDYNTAWVDDDTANPPKANDLGPWAGFLNDSNQADVPFNAGSWTRGGWTWPGSFANAGGATISSYDRPVGDGSYISGGQATAQGTIRFDDTGFRWITQTVTDSNSKTGLMRMPIWTFGGGYQPFTKFKITRRSSSGRDHELVIQAHGDDITEDDIFEGAMVVLFGRTTIDGTEIDHSYWMGCPFEGRSHMLFVGWILENTVRWDYETGTVTFAVSTIGKVANDMPGYATFIKDVTSGDEEDWHTVVAPTVRSAIHFLLHWHSTIPSLCYMEIEPDEIIAGRKFPKSPPFKQVENAFLMQGETAKGLFARLGCSKWGSVHIRYDPQELSDSDRNGVPTVMNLTNADWVEELNIEKRHRPACSGVWGGGIHYDGADGVPYRARAPGTVSLESGRQARGDNLIIQGQADLNTKVGAFLGALASPWDMLPIQLWYDVFEPAFQEYITITISAAENPRGYSFDTSDRLGEAYEAVSLEIPEGPPPPPPPPEPVPLPLPQPIDTGSGDIVAVGTVGAGVCYSLDAVTGVPPTWSQLNTGLSDDSFIEDLTIHPVFPSTFMGCIDNSRTVYRNTAWRTGGTWESVLTEADALSMMSFYSPTDVEFTQVLFGETTMVAVTRVDTASVGYITAIFYSPNLGVDWARLELPEGYVSGFNVGAGCTWLGTSRQWNLRPRSDQQHVGECVMIPGTDLLVMGARCSYLSTGRSQVWRINVADGAGASWDDGCYVPSWAVGSCGLVCGVIHYGLGGNRALAYQNNGPLACCWDDNEGLWWGAQFVRFDDYGDDARIMVHSTGNDDFDSINQAYDSSDLPTGFGQTIGMLASPPLGTSVNWVALEIDDDDNTQVIAENPYNYVGSIVNEYRTAHCFRNLVDGKAIVYAGRSWVTAERANASEQDLFQQSVHTGRAWHNEHPV
jgi:hypothetical protein